MLGTGGLGDIGCSIAGNPAAGLNMKFHYRNQKRCLEAEPSFLVGIKYCSSPESLLKVSDCSKVGVGLDVHENGPSINHER